MSYQAKNEGPLDVQLKVQELCLPFSITASATPAAVVVAQDDPAVLFIKTEGVDRITSAAGALDSGEAVPTYVSQNDANGLFSVLVKVGEPIGKVVGAYIVRRTAHGLDTCKLANTTGISANGDKIALDCDSGVNLTTTSLDAVLVLKYRVS